MATSKIVGIRGLNEDLFNGWRELIIAEMGNGRRRGKRSFVAEALNNFFKRDIAARTRTEPNGDPSKPLRKQSKRDTEGLERVKRRLEGVPQMLLEEFNQVIKDAWGIRDPRAMETARDLAMIELGGKEHPTNPELIDFTQTHR